MENSKKTIKLNIGCGDTFSQNWINLDLFPKPGVKKINVKKRLPFSDNSVDVIYHSHLLEHLEKPQAEKFLLECYRIIKPDGIMRIAVPDLQVICKEYLKNLELAKNTNNEIDILNYKWNKVQLLDQLVRTKAGGEMAEITSGEPLNKDYIESTCGNIFFNKNNKTTKIKKLLNLIKKFKFQQIFIHFKRLFANDEARLTGEKHYWMYDELDLKLILEKIGFKNFMVKECNQSNIENWEYDSLEIDNLGKCRKPDSIFVEVKK